MGHEHSTVQPPDDPDRMRKPGWPKSRIASGDLMGQRVVRGSPGTSLSASNIAIRIRGLRSGKRHRKRDYDRNNQSEASSPRMAANCRKHVRPSFILPDVGATGDLV
jgi:hypothetical protein